MRVAVLNTVLCNTGDAAIFQAISESLAKAAGEEKVEIVALDSLAKTTAKLYPDWEIVQQPSTSSARNRYVRGASNVARRIILRLLVRSRALRTLALSRAGRSTGFGRAVGAIADADLVVSSGGTYLVDHYNFGHRVDEMLLSYELGHSVILWTQSMGPFESPSARESIEGLHQKVAGVYFRDEKSKRAWRELLPLPITAEVVPDCVFSLEPDILGRQRQGTDENFRKPIALISVRNWSLAVGSGEFNFSTYASAMRTVSEDLLRRGWRCIAVSTCQGVPEYGIDDAATARSIFAGLDVEINAEFHSPEDLLELISSADLVIATRMHLAILSLLSGKPVHAIAYESKTVELFRSFGHPHAVTAIEDATPRWASDLAVRGGISTLAVSLSDPERGDLRERAGKPARSAIASIRNTVAEK